MNELKTQVENILNSELPGFSIYVGLRKHFDGTIFLAAKIATSDYLINNVEGQKHNCISFRIEDDLELAFQVFGGNGGQCFYRKVDPNNESEKYYAMKGVKIPFRTPKKDKIAVLKAIKTICQRYKALLKETYENGLLYSDNLETTKQLIYNN